MNYATEPCTLCPWAWISSFIFVFACGRRRECVLLRMFVSIQCGLELVWRRKPFSQWLNGWSTPQQHHSTFPLSLSPYSVSLVSLLQSPSLSFFHLFKLFPHFRIHFTYPFHLGLVTPVINIRLSVPVQITSSSLKRQPTSCLQWLCFCQRRQ